MTYTYIHHHMAGNMLYKNGVQIRLGTWNIGTLNGKGLAICGRAMEEECSFVLLTRGEMERMWG